MKDKKIVITGGLGFIGSHLANELSKNNEVTVIDNGSTGDLKNLENENIEVIMKDINEVNLKKIFEDKDYVFHHAAIASVPRSIENPIECHKVNVTGSLKVLLAARDTDVKKVINASSSAVYGDNPNLPLSEDDSLNPLSPYAASKASSELYCKVFNEVYGLKTVSLRYFNVFGPKQNPHSQYAAVIPKFIYKMIKNEPPKIYGDGTQTRDFIYVKDVVKINIKVAESNFTGVLNVARGESISVNKLFRLIKEILDVEVEPIYTDPRPGDIKHSWADISLLKSKLKFKPGNFKEQLKETIEWFKQQIYIQGQSS
nr:SDR family oxidoreductase [Methanothermus fervidus]